MTRHFGVRPCVWAHRVLLSDGQFARMPRRQLLQAMMTALEWFNPWWASTGIDGAGRRWDSVGIDGKPVAGAPKFEPREFPCVAPNFDDSFGYDIERGEDGVGDDRLHRIQRQGPHDLTINVTMDELMAPGAAAAGAAAATAADVAAMSTLVADARARRKALQAGARTPPRFSST